jgi:hypothetical protein
MGESNAKVPENPGAPPLVTAVRVLPPASSEQTVVPEALVNEMAPLDFVTEALTCGVVTTMAVPLSVASHAPGSNEDFTTTNPCGEGIVVRVVYTTRMIFPPHNWSLSRAPLDIRQSAPSDSLEKEVTVSAWPPEKFAAHITTKEPRRIALENKFIIHVSLLFRFELDRKLFIVGVYRQ